MIETSYLPGYIIHSKRKYIPTIPQKKYVWSTHAIAKKWPQFYHSMPYGGFASSWNLNEWNHTIHILFLSIFFDFTYVLDWPILCLIAIFFLILAIEQTSVIWKILQFGCPTGHLVSSRLVSLKIKLLPTFPDELIGGIYFRFSRVNV